jgi:hypothetical protein
MRVKGSDKKGLAIFGGYNGSYGLPHEVRAKFAFAKVIGANMAIDRAGLDSGRSDVDSLDSIASFFEHLNWLSRLTPNVPQSDSRIK